MFSILQIVLEIFGAVLIVATIAVASVWVKRQTHVSLTPGEMAEDRVKVARAERDIASLTVEREVHNFALDRVLDARTDPQGMLEGDLPLPLRLDPVGYKLLSGEASGHKAKILGDKIYYWSGKPFGDLPIYEWHEE